MNEPLVTAREVGEYLGLSTATVLDKWEAGELPGFKLPGGPAAPVRFRLSEIDALLESCRRGPSPAGVAGPDTPRSTRASIGPRPFTLSASQHVPSGAEAQSLWPEGSRALRKEVDDA